MADLVIIGAGGHGRETLDVVEACNAAGADWNFLGFVDDDPRHLDRVNRRNGAVLGPIRSLSGIDAQYVIGIGSTSTRQTLDEDCNGYGRNPATLIHPLAIVGSDNRLAPGVVLAAGAMVTTNVSLGRHVHCNIASLISHDCQVGDYCTLSPGAILNGNVTLGKSVFLGTGAIITPGRTIGDGAVIGAGAVVVSDVSPGATFVGVPAKPIKGPK